MRPAADPILQEVKAEIANLNVPVPGTMKAENWPSTLVTALALSLGAPFWFDLLNRLVNLRQTGKPPDENGRGVAAAH